MDELADQSDALRQAAIRAQDTRRVALEQIVGGLAGLLIVGQLQIRCAVAQTQFYFVEFAGLLYVTTVGFAFVAGSGSRQNVQARGSNSLAGVSVQHPFKTGDIKLDAAIYGSTVEAR